MVGKCEVTWAGPGWNKNNNDDGRDSDDRDDDGDDSCSFICMGLHGDDDRHNHCDGDDHHCEFEPGGQGRGSNGQRHQVYKQKPSYSSLSCLIRTFIDGSTHHVLLFIKILAVQDKTNLIITLLIALLINFNDPAWSPGLGLQNHHHHML